MEIQNKGNSKKVNNNNKMNNFKNQNIKKIKNNKVKEEEDDKLNIIEYKTNSELKTKKKEFINKIDPHNLKRLIQKER